MKVGRIAQERRKAPGLTYEQAAEALGISAPAVNKWERDFSIPDGRSSTVPNPQRLPLVVDSQTMPFAPRTSTSTAYGTQRPA